MKRVLISSAVAAALLAGCSKDEDSSDSTDTTATTTIATTGTGIQSSIALANKLAVAFPASLALSVFPTGTAAALALDDAAPVAGPVEPVKDGKPAAEKVKDREKKLTGDATECLDLSLLKELNAGAQVTCYDFDSDMNPFVTPEHAQAKGAKDGTDGKGEACMVAFARNETQDSVATIDTALELFSGMLRQAKKEGQGETVLLAGDSLDLATSFGKAGGGKIAVTEAKLARLADVDGVAVYRSDIALTGDNGRTFAAHLLHAPGAAGEKGTLWFKRSGGETKPAGMQADPNDSANKNHVLSISYEKSTVDGSPHMTFEVRRAAISNALEPFTDGGLVNYA